MNFINKAYQIVLIVLLISSATYAQNPKTPKPQNPIQLKLKYYNEIRIIC